MAGADGGKRTHKERKESEGDRAPTRPEVQGHLLLPAAAPGPLAATPASDTARGEVIGHFFMTKPHQIEQYARTRSEAHLADAERERKVAAAVAGQGMADRVKAMIRGDSRQRMNSAAPGVKIEADARRAGLA